MSAYGSRTHVESIASYGCKRHTEFLKHAEEFNDRTPVKTIPVCASWAKRTRPRSRLCFMNAQMFALDHPEAKYYEGYWTGCIIPIHHGWIVLDGQVIDFTAEAAERSLKRKKINTSYKHDYFGIHIPTEFVRESMLKSKMWEDIMWKYLNRYESPSHIS